MTEQLKMKALHASYMSVVINGLAPSARLLAKLTQKRVLFTSYSFGVNDAVHILAPPPLPLFSLKGK